MQSNTIKKTVAKAHCSVVHPLSEEDSSAVAQGACQ